MSTVVKTPPSVSLKALVDWVISGGDELPIRIRCLRQYASERAPPMWNAFLANMSLNRYSDVVCYDRNRVILQDGQPYIHANEIHLPGNSHFILTQAPLEHTLNDFWRLVLQYKPYIIACMYEPSANEMVCPVSASVDNRKGKLDPNIIIQCASVSQTADKGTNVHWTSLETTITSKSITHTFRYVTFCDWHKDDLPPSPEIMLELVADIQRLSKEMHLTKYGNKLSLQKPLPPVVTVCPTGSIRSGLLAATDAFFKSAERKQGEVSVPKVAYVLRSSRFGCICSKTQYAYLYWIVCEMARTHSNFAPNCDHQQLEMACENIRRLVLPSQPSYIRRKPKSPSTRA